MGVKHLFQCVLVGMRIIVLCKECSGGNRLGAVMLKEQLSQT